MRYIPSWVPGTGWKKDAVKYRKTVIDAVLEPYEFVKRQMVLDGQLTNYYPISTDFGLCRLRVLRFQASAPVI